MEIMRNLLLLFLSQAFFNFLFFFIQKTIVLCYLTSERKALKWFANCKTRPNILTNYAMMNKVKNVKMSEDVLNAAKDNDVRKKNGTTTIIHN